MEALNLCLQAVTQPGDVVAIEAPAFYGCLQALSGLQLKAVEVATHPRLGVQVDALRPVLNAIPSRPAGSCQLPEPHGALMPATRRRRSSKLVTRHRVPLSKTTSTASSTSACGARCPRSPSIARAG
jgi:DNA-binding transcriptional MocR family regulator